METYETFEPLEIEDEYYNDMCRVAWLCMFSEDVTACTESNS